MKTDVKISDDTKRTTAEQPARTADTEGGRPTVPAQAQDARDRPEEPYFVSVRKLGAS
jgi:hypothetical protein